MTVILDQNVNLRANQNPIVSPGLQIADSIERVRATLTHWNGTETAQILTQLSFDGGTTWRDVAAIGPSTSPSGTFKNRVDLWVEVFPTWRLCGFVFPVDSRYRPGQVCGEMFYTGYPAQTTIHSDWAFQDTTPLPDLSSVNFHDPNLTPLTGGPLRQMRAVITVSGNVNSRLVVDAT